MKHYAFCFLLAVTLLPFSSFAQENKLDFKFYGFLRADICYDNRMSVVGNEGLFFLYPLDIKPDANGQDLNSQASLGLYSFNARPGVEISGLHVFGADVVGKMEADFAGFGGQYGNSSILRIRLAYMKMMWDKSSLLIGQDWHPFFGPVTPGQISLSTGAPFNPFNRSPQLRYNYAINNKWSVSAAALYQFQFSSQGVDGKSTSYQKYALMPEWLGMLNYQTSSFTAGVGANLLTLKPRRTSSWNSATYKVDESLYSAAFTAYLKYTDNLFSVGAKTIYGSNMTHLSMLGGYGVKSQNSETGELEYTNFKTSSSWVNFSYGKKYLCNLFLGYAKNLGSEDALLENSTQYGEGLAVDNLSRVAASFSYNVPHFRLGIEYEFSHANYGNSDSFSWESGKMSNTHSVNNSRVIGVISYLF